MACNSGKESAIKCRLQSKAQQIDTVTLTEAHKHAKYKKLKDYNVNDYYCVGHIHIKMPACNCIYDHKAS